jgi:hypothetical protein
VGHLVVEDERAAGLEMLVDSPESFFVVVSPPAEAEAAAHEDRSVPPRQIELVHRLLVEVR